MTTHSDDQAQQVTACRRRSAEGIVDRSEILKDIRARLGAVNGQGTADGLGVTRSCSDAFKGFTLECTCRCTEHCF